MSDLFDNNGATFSDLRTYRYELHRIWDAQKPLIMFIGLNPSTANENKNDNTINRVRNFSSDWGYGGFYMMNLFAYVTPYPEELKTCGDPLGENDGWLEEIAPKCEKIIFCWGAFKEAKDRAQKVIAMFPDAYCLGVNSDRSPKHPLYLDGDTKPVLYQKANPYKLVLYRADWSQKKTDMNNAKYWEWEIQYNGFKCP